TSATTTAFAPAPAQASAKARPRPRPAPVTTIVLPSSVAMASGRGLAGLGGLEFGARILLQNAAQLRHADVVLIQHLALGPVSDTLQDDAVLLEHVPMPLFQAVAVHEAPDVTLPTRH